VSLQLQNPHSILAAIDSRPEEVFQVQLQTRAPGGAWRDVVEAAKRYKIPVVRGGDRQDPRRQTRRRQSAESKTGRTSGSQATVKERDGVSLRLLFDQASARVGGRGLWLALDHIQDPHNVGALFRTAAFFGVQGIVLTKDQSAPLNATVYDVAAGGIESVPFLIQTNLSRTLQSAKEAGLWILGASEHAEADIGEFALDRPWMLVLGNEEKGIRRLNLQMCDALCRLTPRGNVTSLNVSVAAGILIATLSR